MKTKKRKVEWSFDFESLGDRFSEFFSSFSEEVETHTEHFSEALDHATEAEIKIANAVGKTVISALANDANLIEADVTYIGEVGFSVNGDDVKKVKLQHKSRRFSPRMKRSEELLWDVRLTKSIPLALRVSGGVGKTRLDLNDLQLKKLKAENSIGEMQITLPVQETSLDASVKGGVGKTQINIPAGLSADLRVKTGVGMVDIRVAKDTGVRVKVSDSLSGVQVPDHFQSTRKQDSFFTTGGVWQTPDFDEASHQVMIAVDHGIGRVNIETHEIV